MEVKTGVDIVHIPTFARSLTEGGEPFLDRVYTPKERARATSAERCAGLFAVKEAVVKALGLPKEGWQAIEVSHQEDGKPVVTINNTHYLSGDISIAHHGEYAVATATFLL